MLTSTNFNFEKNYEKEEYEILILVEVPSYSGCVYENGFLGNIDFYASIDLRTGKLSCEEGRLQWFKDGNYNDFVNVFKNTFKPFGIYRVTVRKCIQKNMNKNLLPLVNNDYMLINVLEENVPNKKLEKLKKYYTKPIYIKNDIGCFLLERKYSWFEGNIDWFGKKIRVLLETDVRNGNTAKKTMKILKKLVKNFNENDIKYREFAAKNLTSLINDWVDEYDEGEKITVEEFKNEMTIGTIYIDSDGLIDIEYFSHHPTIEINVIKVIVNSDCEVIETSIED